MGNFKDFNTAVRQVRVMDRVAVRAVKRIYPLPRFATVVSIDTLGRKVTVSYPDEAGTFTVPVFTIMPAAIGSLVRVNGPTGKRYVDAVLDGSVKFNRLAVGNPGNGYASLTAAVADLASGLWLTSEGMNTISKITPPVVFGSTDPQLTTRNPKPLASIHGEATQAYSSDGAGGMDIVFSTTANTAGANSTPAEAMRISTGPLAQPNVHVGNDVNNGGQDHRLLLGPASSSRRNLSSYGNSVATRTHFSFVNPNGIVGVISTNGTSTTYGTSSDERLKTSLRRASGRRIRDLIIHDFEWKSDRTPGVGVFAQEAHKVIPEAVEPGGANPDIDPWVVDYSKFVPDLIAYSQSLERRIEALEACVADLMAQRTDESPPQPR